MGRERVAQLEYSEFQDAMLDETKRRRKAAKIIAVLGHFLGRLPEKGAFDGLMVADIGCSAGFVNVPRIKGSHNAMLSGMFAAEAAAAEDHSADQAATDSAAADSAAAGGRGFGECDPGTAAGTASSTGTAFGYHGQLGSQLQQPSAAEVSTAGDSSAA